MEQVKPRIKNIYYDDNGLTTIDQLDRSDYTIIYFYFFLKRQQEKQSKKRKKKNK